MFTNFQHLKLREHVKLSQRFASYLESLFLNLEETTSTNIVINLYLK